jgi:hypothetical protein
MKMVAFAFPPVTRSVDQGAHDSDAEPTDRALFYRSIQIGPGRCEQLERRPVVDEWIISRPRLEPSAMVTIPNAHPPP